MAHSLSQEVEWTCPRCKQQFRTEVWLIVDTAERPDLLERIRSGSLHALPCPHCGHQAMADAPLLLYRPGETPPLLFSPARGTTTEQDREQAAGLVGALRERLGAAWQDEWVAEGLPGAPRELLPTALAQGLEGALRQAQEQARQAQERAVAARQALDGRPPAERARGLLIRGAPPILDRLIAGERAAAATVTRYTDITCPRRVWVETPRIAVVVQLTLSPPERSAAAETLALQRDTAVAVRIEAPAFDLLNAPEQEVTLPPDTDSPPLVFYLRPREVGPTRVNLDFFQNGNRMGTASVPVEVTPYEVSETTESKLAQAVRIEPGAAPPDLELAITYERFRQQPALVFTLRRAGEAGRTFAPVYLEGDLDAQTTRLYDILTVLAERLDPTVAAVVGKQRVVPPETADARLQELGQNLWKNLIPQELKTVYAAERAAWRDKSLLIISDEPYIPWELVWPYDEDWEDETPWCLTMGLTRWLRRDARGNGHEAPPVRLTLETLACLAPTDSDLPAAQVERQVLGELIARHRVSDVSPLPPTWPNVIGLLKQGGYDWLHVAAHGNFYPTAPDADSAIWLQDLQPLAPEAIVGPAIERHIRQKRPGFVFNACHAGRQGWGLTRIGGWTNRLISAGAGLFIAPLWSVTDGPALDFARAFYERLLAGEALAAAVRAGRLAAREAGDPTWLAYSVYGHPNARVVV